MKSEKERQIPYDITYMWNLKYGTNEPNYEPHLTDTENRLVLTKWERGEEGKDWEAGISRCKLLNIEQHTEQTIKVLLCHTGTIFNIP